MGQVWKVPLGSDASPNRPLLVPLHYFQPLFWSYHFNILSPCLILRSKQSHFVSLQSIFINFSHLVNVLALLNLFWQIVLIFVAFIQTSFCSYSNSRAIFFYPLEIFSLPFGYILITGFGYFYSIVFHFLYFYLLTLHKFESGIPTPYWELHSTDIDKLTSLFGHLGYL